MSVHIPKGAELVSGALTPVLDLRDCLRALATGRSPIGSLALKSAPDFAENVDSELIPVIDIDNIVHPTVRRRRN